MQLVTVEQVAEMLQIATRSVWRLRDSGKMPSPISLGKCVRWKADEMEAWITDGCPDVRKTRWTAPNMSDGGNTGAKRPTAAQRRKS